MMCSTSSKALMTLGVVSGLLNHWFILIALYPVTANLLSRLLHRNIWPAKAICPIPSKSAYVRLEEGMEKTK